MFDKIVENSTFAVGLKRTEGTNSCRASFEIKPTTGKHFHVFKGKGYCYKGLTPMDVVVRAIKNYNALSEDFEPHQLCNETARIMAQHFNKLYSGLKVKVQFVGLALTAIDQRAMLTKYYKNFKKGESVVVEKRLDGKFMYFVSNRVAPLQNDMDVVVLEAFCHFTFQESGGSFVICGLKGIRKTNTFEFTLTNPTIHSTNGRFGEKDKRDAGIEDFRNNHKCNSFCEKFALSTGTDDVQKGSDEY